MLLWLWLYDSYDFTTITILLGLHHSDRYDVITEQLKIFSSIVILWDHPHIYSRYAMVTVYKL